MFSGDCGVDSHYEIGYVYNNRKHQGYVHTGRVFAQTRSDSKIGPARPFFHLFIRNIK